MGILGIGVDVVSLTRIATLSQRRTYDRLAKRILSADELSAFCTIPDDARTRFLAVRCVGQLLYSQIAHTHSCSQVEYQGICLQGAVSETDHLEGLHVYQHDCH